MLNYVQVIPDSFGDMGFSQLAFRVSYLGKNMSSGQPFSRTLYFFHFIVSEGLVISIFGDLGEEWVCPTSLRDFLLTMF